MKADEAFLIFRLYESLVDEGRGWRGYSDTDRARIREAAWIAYDHELATAHQLWDVNLMDNTEHAALCDCQYAKNYRGVRR